MSEQPELRHKKAEAIEILPTERDFQKSSYSNSSVWMARWTSYSADSLNGSSNFVLKRRNNQSFMANQGNSQIEVMKTRFDEQLMMGIMTNHKSCPDRPLRFNSDDVGIPTDVSRKPRDLHLTGDQYFGNCNVRESAELSNSKDVLANRFSVHNGAPYRDNLLMPHNINSGSTQFPIYINGQIGNILKRNRRLTSDRVCVPEQYTKANLSTTRLMATSSSEYMYHARKYYEAKGKHTESAVCWTNGHVSPVKSCSCSDAENESSSSQHLLQEQNLDSNRDIFKLEVYNDTCQRKSVCSEGISDEKIYRSSTGCQFSGALEGYIAPKRLSLDDTCSQLRAAEYRAESLHKIAKSAGYEINLSKDRNVVENGQAHPVELGRRSLVQLVELEGATSMTEKSRKYSKSADNLSKKRTAEWLPQGESMVLKPANSIKRSGRYLFEMLTMPSQSHEGHEKVPDSVGKLKGYLMREYDGSDNVPTAQDGSLNKKLCVGAAPRKYEGTFSSLAKKTCAGSCSTPFVLKSCRQGESQRNGEKMSYGGTTSASKVVMSISSRESMDADHAFPASFSLPDLGTDLLHEKLVFPEPSNRWLKRFRPTLPCPPAFAAKRLKVDDAPLAGEMGSLFNMVVNYGMVAPNLTESHTSELKCERDGKPVNCSEVPSPVSPKNLQCWIQRWCCSGNHQAASNHSQPSNHPADISGKSKMPRVIPAASPFPSIGAMAMMGKAMSKFRPCEYQRRGPSIVWNN